MTDFVDLEETRKQIESQLESKDEVAGVQLITFHGQVEGVVDVYADLVSNLDAYADELSTLDDLTVTNAVVPQQQMKLSNPFGVSRNNEQYDETVYRYEIVCLN